MKNLEINLESGPIIGFKDGKILKYLGVPYGHIPARFERATEPENWTTPRNCDKSYDYPQNQELNARLAKFLPVMSNPPYPMSQENELLLDVHVPVNGEKLPVMVYIHGGSYQIGGPGSESFIGSKTDKFCFYPACTIACKLPSYF